MAPLTGPGDAAVDDHPQLSLLSGRMAQPAGDAFVRPGKRKSGVFVVVEFRRPPVGDRVAPRAIGLGGGAGGELPRVGIGVAGRARFGRPRKGRQPPRPEDRRFVASGAWHAAVLAGQAEAGPVVIESLGFPPRPGNVARLASKPLCSRGKLLAGSQFSRAEVRIGMAMAAGRLRQAEDSPFIPFLVAVGTGNRSVGASQREPAPAVVSHRIVNLLP